MNRFFNSGAAILGAGVALLAVAGITRAHAADVEVGQPAPAFALPDESGRIHTLEQYRGKLLILAFYPKDFTGG